MSGVAFWVLPLIFVVLGWVFVPMIRGQQQGGQIASTQATIDQILQDVRDAQLDFELGRLSEEDYLSIKNEKETLLATLV